MAVIIGKDKRSTFYDMTKQSAAAEAQFSQGEKEYGEQELP